MTVVVGLSSTSFWPTETNVIFLSTNSEIFYYHYVSKTLKPMNFQIFGCLFDLDTI